MSLRVMRPVKHPTYAVPGRGLSRSVPRAGLPFPVGRNRARRFQLAGEILVDGDLIPANDTEQAQYEALERAINATISDSTARIEVDGVLSQTDARALIHFARLVGADDNLRSGPILTAIAKATDARAALDIINTRGAGNVAAEMSSVAKTAGTAPSKLILGGIAAAGVIGLFFLVRR